MMKYLNEIWLADFNHAFGTEVGKIRPVVIVQTDILNEVEHPSTIVCPITTNVQNSQLLRVRLNNSINGLNVDSDILVDQLRSIDNQRFIKRLGVLTKTQAIVLKNNLKIMMDLE